MPLLSQREAKLKTTMTAKRATAAAVEDCFEEAREAKRAPELAWYDAMAYYLGIPLSKQFAWTDDATLLDTKSSNANFVSVVHNFTIPNVMRTVSRLTSHNPWCGVMPATTEKDDASSARLATKLLEFWRTSIFSPPQRVRFASWIVTCGSAFYRVGWDSYAGRSLARRSLAPAGETVWGATTEGKPLQPPSSPVDRWLEEVAQTDRTATGGYGGLATTSRSAEALMFDGDVTVDVVSPFEVYPEPFVADFDRLTWMIHARMRTRDDIEAHWGVKATKDMKAVDWGSDDAAGFNPVKFSGMTDSPYASALGIPTNNQQEMVLVLEYWERPSQAHMDGRRVLVIGGKAVIDEPNPYPHRDFPFAMSVFEMLPTSMWGRGLVENIVPAVEEYNITLEQIGLARDYVCHPPILVPRGAQIKPVLDQNFPGRMWAYNYPQRPEPMQMPQLPAYLSTLLEYNKGMIDDLSFLHEASVGQAPPNVRAGVAMQILQEADDRPLRPTYDMHDESIRRCCQMLLGLAQRYYTTPRMIRLMGKGREYEVTSFQGSDLRGAADVIVDPRSAAPQSLAMRRQEVMDLFGSGLLGNPGDPTVAKRALKMMENGHLWDVIADEFTLEEQIIEEMKAMMAGGDGQPGGLGALVGGLRQQAGPAPGPPGPGGQAPAAGMPMPDMGPAGF